MFATRQLLIQAPCNLRSSPRLWGRNLRLASRSRTRIHLHRQTRKSHHEGSRKICSSWTSDTAGSFLCRTGKVYFACVGSGSLCGLQEVALTWVGRCPRLRQDAAKCHGAKPTAVRSLFPSLPRLINRIKQNTRAEIFEHVSSPLKVM